MEILEQKLSRRYEEREDLTDFADKKVGKMMNQLHKTAKDCDPTDYKELIRRKKLFFSDKTKLRPPPLCGCEEHSIQNLKKDIKDLEQDLRYLDYMMEFMDEADEKYERRVKKWREERRMSYVPIVDRSHLRIVRLTITAF